MRVLKFGAIIVLAFAISYVKADGAHSHEHHHESSYGAPEPAPEPAPAYGAPEPAPSYGAPEPAPSYGAPAPAPPIDLTPYIVAIMVIIGLSLLFPTQVRIENTGRRKREAEEIARSDFVGRTAEIYDHLNDVLEPVDRRCLEKITCEVGALSYDAGLTSSPFLQLAVPFVPGKYAKYVKHFIYAENCHKIKCSAYP